MRSIKLALAAALSLAGLSAPAMAGCALTDGSGPIKHVVYLQFDNVHFLRDLPKVPSDLEQMPTLLNFLRDKGMLLSNDHTQLISHTANGILTSITGVYPDRLAAGAISNSFAYYNANGNPNHFNGSFVYWTDRLAGDNDASGNPNPGADTSYVLLAETGKNAPAPWVPYTRAGCDVGAVGIADMDLENTSTDLATVFGRDSEEYAEGTSASSTTRNQALADFEGIALHCGRDSALCGSAPSAAKVSSDILPDEPGGYDGFKALFGHKYVVPALKAALGGTPDNKLNDLSGNPIGYLTVSASGGEPVATVQPGFPGFDGMFPTVTLSYAATMLEAGVPVVYGYFSDAHDHHYATVDGVNPQGSAFAYGPGEAGYVSQLAQYDNAFAQFFDRLSNDGIDESNTLFVILVEEGDVFVGSRRPQPPGCDGINTPCTYPPIETTGTRPSKGEVSVNFDTLLATQRGNTTAFAVHADQAPAVSIAGNPSPTDALTRQFERDLLALTVPNPYLGNRSVPMVLAMADRAELGVLHMVTADPLRTPTLVAFNFGDFYAGSGTVDQRQPGCEGQAVCTNPSFAWNHGGIEAVVRTTWTGMVGPGVRNVGVDGVTWTDHTDVRPTMFALLGLTDDYAHDGRIVAENLELEALPSGIAADLESYTALAAAYKRLNAPFQVASMASLRVATRALRTGSADDDSVYTDYLEGLGSFVAERDGLVAEIKSVLQRAAVGGRLHARITRELAERADRLTARMVRLDAETR